MIDPADPDWPPVFDRRATAMQLAVDLCAPKGLSPAQTIRIAEQILAWLNGAPGSGGRPMAPARGAREH